MGPGGTFALVTFTAGIILLLGWLYATAGNARSVAMMKKSLLLFALPILLAPAQLFQFPFGMWIWIACEEGLKAFVSTRERARINRFWLVTLFGIWELTLDKPFWALALWHEGETWSRLEIFGLVCATTLPVLMHTVTAAIYAFTFKRALWAAFIASWVLHTAFNESVNYFGLSPTAGFVELAILAAILWALLACHAHVQETEVIH